jgi:hypothetical protein
MTCNDSPSLCSTLLYLIGTYVLLRLDFWNN